MKKLFILIFSSIFCLGTYAQTKATCVLTADTFNTKSYAANDGEHNIVGSDGKTYVFTTFDVMQSSKYKSIQMRKKTGAYIAPPADVVVDSIVINLGTSAYMNLSAKVNEDTVSPIKVNDTIYYIVPGQYDSLKLINASNYAAQQKSVVFYFTVASIQTKSEQIGIPVSLNKVLHNGTLYIQKEEELYTITGQKMN